MSIVVAVFVVLSLENCFFLDYFYFDCPHHSMFYLCTYILEITFMDSKLNEIHLFYFVVLNNSNNNNDDNCNYFYSFEYFCLRL